MTTPAITVDGVKELNRQLRQVKDKGLDSELKALHKDIADEVIRKAQRRVPMRSGALKRSLRGSGTKAAAVGRAGKKAVPYAPTIHWGWPKRGIKPQPFLRQAAESVERDIVERYDRAISDLLDKTIKGR